MMKTLILSVAALGLSGCVQFVRPGEAVATHGVTIPVPTVAIPTDGVTVYEEEHVYVAPGYPVGSNDIVYEGYWPHRVYDRHRGDTKIIVPPVVVVDAPVQPYYYTRVVREPEPVRTSLPMTTAQPSNTPSHPNIVAQPSAQGDSSAQPP